MAPTTATEPENTPLDDAVVCAQLAIQNVIGLLGTTGSDREALLEAVRSVESIGRLADVARVRVLEPFVDDESGMLPSLGFTSDSEAIAAVTGISKRSAHARFSLAEAIIARRTLTGADIPALRPVLSEALDAGLLGIEAAGAIVRELKSVGKRADDQMTAAGENLMVSRATGIDPVTGEKTIPVEGEIFYGDVTVEFLTQELRQIASAMDPDGALSREQKARAGCYFTVGRQNSRGLMPVHGEVLPETGLLFLAQTEAARRTPQFFDPFADTLPEGSVIAGGVPVAPSQDGIAAAPLHDDRTPGQRMHDVFAAMVAAAATADSPTLDGATPTVLVTVTLADLNDPRGVDSDPIGTMAGATYPVSRKTVQRFIDAGGYQEVALDPNGAVIGISSKQRCFTSAQRKAVAARDGHCCTIPGCTAPPHTLQAHHVLDWQYGGTTDTCNCVLLCFWHHLTIDSGPWQIRMQDGIPYVRGPGNPDWVKARPAIPARLTA